MDFRRLNHADATDMVTRVEMTRIGVHAASPSLRPNTMNPVSHLRVSKSAYNAACAASEPL